MSNTETKPWEILAQKQVRDDEQRNKDEMFMNHIIKENYKKELYHQMQQRREHEKKARAQQRVKDRQVIMRNVGDEKRAIQFEKLKSKAYNERQLRFDLQNEYEEQLKKQKFRIMKEINDQRENEAKQRAQMTLRMERQEEEKRKAELRRDLKQTIQHKKDYQKFQKQQEIQFENLKMQEKEMMNNKQQFYRNDYLQRLKQRSMTIDYGAHRAFQDNVNKTLIQRKKQEWRTDRDLVSYNLKSQNQQELQIHRKNAMKNLYKDELQRQMVERQHEKRYKTKKQIEDEIDTIQRSNRINYSVELGRKNENEAHKKNHLKYLQQQISEKKRLKRDHLAMRQKQYSVNLEMLEKQNGIVPGNTYHLDPNRKKQLEYVAKSMAYSPQIKEPAFIPQNYLAERGKKLI